jgi:hypothetical protein
MIHRSTAFCLAIGAVAGFLNVDTARAQVCSDVASVGFLGGQTAGRHGVPAIVYDGSPIVGATFALRIENGRPNSMAAIAMSVVHTPLALSDFGATIHPGEPFDAVFVLPTDDNGATPIAVSTGSIFAGIGPSYCGLEFFIQGMVVDADAVGGIAFTAGKRFVVGQPQVAANKLFKPEIGLDGPTDVATADFNRDGFADLAITNAQLDEVAVLLGRGDGRFQKRVGFAVGDYPHRIVTADFDNDGRSDLATVNAQSSTYSILLGDGLGSFAPATHFQLAAVGQDLDVGDVDGDGSADIVVGLRDSGLGNNDGIAVFRGDGAGGFAHAVTLPTAEEVRRVALGDVNADGWLDIVAISNNQVIVYRGNGDATFGSPMVYGQGTAGVPFAPSDLVLADLNKDGLCDIVLCNPNFYSIVTMTALPGGGFTALPTGNTTVAYPYALAVADVSGDGALDVVTANQDDTFVVAFGQFTGQFVVGEYYEAGDQPQSIVLVDLNGDGMRDVVIVNEVSDDLTVVLNQLLE